MDVAGGTTTMIKALLFFILFFCLSALAESSFLRLEPGRNLSGFEYAAGFAAAKAGNYESAYQLFESGWLRSAGRDLRFLSALAGVSYKLEQPDRAKEYLIALLKEKPRDEYANRLIGTLFLLEGNIEASLKYLNRIDEPKIVNVRLQPLPNVDAAMMDQALAISPASRLSLDEFLETQSRLQQTETFKDTDFYLQPRSEGRSFDLIVRSRVKKGTLGSKLKIAIAFVQALFTQTVKPEFHNIGGKTISSTSLLSWDEYRHRFHSSLSLPYGNRPHSRIRLFADTRNETWKLATDLDVLRWEAGLELRETHNSWLSWNGGAKISHRQFESLIGDGTGLFQNGWRIHLFAGSDQSVLRIPEKRLTIHSQLLAETALRATSSFDSSVLVQHSIQMNWYPRARDDDYAMSAALRTGALFGDSTFDQLFVLGMERDTDLALRAHKSSLDKKGGNPFASRYLLLNWDISKNVMQHRLHWRVIPFVDAALLPDQSLWKGDRLLVDAGIQSAFRVFGSPEIVFTYGKDLRSGRNVFYVSLTP